MAKAKKKKEIEEEIPKIDPEILKRAETVYGDGTKHELGAAVLPIDTLFPSPTNPRTVFEDKPLDELASSIQTHGVLQNLIVRQAWIESETGRQYCGFEIIAGERRWRASQMVDLNKLPVTVTDLSDDDVLDVQLVENWQRQNLAPLDDARGLKFIIDRKGWTLDELSIRLSRPVSTLAKILKLNDLCESGQKALHDELLPVTHAYKIARYTTKQQESLIKEAYGKAFERIATVTLAQLNHLIGKVIETDLGSACFSLKATDLHPDGLSCIHCPQRTGSNPSLFDDIDPAEDRCLNSACFNSKTEAYYLNQVDELTKKGKKKFGKDYQALVLTNEYERPSNFTAAVLLDRQEIADIEAYFYRKREEVCRTTEQALFVSKWADPRFIDICRDKECPKHLGYVMNSTQAAAEKKEANTRKEFDFESTVRRLAGRRVLFEIANILASPDNEHTLSIKPDLLPFIATDITLLSRKKRIADELIYAYISNQKGADIIDGPNSADGEFWFKENMTNGQMEAVIFLGLYGDMADPFNYGELRSFGPLIKLALHYGINYRWVEAEERYALCEDPKHQVKLSKYLGEVSAGNLDAKIPRQFDKSFTVDDSIPGPGEEPFFVFAEDETKESSEAESGGINEESGEETDA